MLTIQKILYFASHLLLFTLACLLLIVPVVILRIYKSITIFIANKIFKLELIPFDDGMQGIDLTFLRADATELLRKQEQPKISNNNNVQLITANAGVIIKYEENTFALDKIREIFYENFLKHPANIKYINLQIKLVKFCGYFFKQKVKNVDLENVIHSVDISDEIIMEGCLADWFLHPFRSKQG